jgi:CRISPR-associated endonuclease/helicase Cas3
MNEPGQTMTEQDFANWFHSVTRQTAHPWQLDVAQDAECRDRLIRIPTGMGKTLGVFLAWLWHSVQRQDLTWPSRLVWCLPMRALVEQTADGIREVLDKLGLLWDGTSMHEGKVGLHVLMGGIDSGEWHLHPERHAVLVGTQDMLLSRALNRGYACGRARWPMEFGLLNHDCLWVMDEVQLMDVGLATSVQLQSFRVQDASRGFRPCRTWWMSATLQPAWMETVDSRNHMPGLRGSVLSIPAGQRQGLLWSIPKPIEMIPIPAEEDRDCRKLAEKILQVHDGSQAGPHGRITLAIVNTVSTATSVYGHLLSVIRKQNPEVDLRLVHSRFRGLERRHWLAEFLARRHCSEGVNRIIVATQVVEAGVDISATGLVTQLAPWPSLVQRFGRAGRYGGSAQVVVVDRLLTGEDCLPYVESELDAAKRALSLVGDVGLSHLEQVEEDLARNDPGLLADLYPYDPLHILTRRECDELFDTSADLSGADLDISRFIRSGEDRDLLVCWADWPRDAESDPPPELQPLRDGLCPVPVAQARKWLLEKGSRKEGCRAWVWDYLDGRWRKLTPRDCFPGRTVLVASTWGGYDAVSGFTGGKPRAEAPTFSIADGVRDSRDDEYTELAQDFEDQSICKWKTIATHGAEAARQVAALGRSLGISPDLAHVLDLAGRLHDWGKAHPAFASSILRVEGHPGRTDLAKAPKNAWAELTRLYCLDGATGPRRGFRHELASVLALFELLFRLDRVHDALLGPFQELVAAGVLGTPAADPTSEDLRGSPLCDELQNLPAPSFDLLAYLIVSHHGKVRGAWQGTRHDQDFPDDERYLGTGQPLRGVREGDLLPAVELAVADGSIHRTPALSLHLDPAILGLSSRYGPSWGQRVHGLMDRFGPFALAWLETILRVADVRASRLDVPDPLLDQGDRA